MITCTTLTRYHVTFEHLASCTIPCILLIMHHVSIGPDSLHLFDAVRDARSRCRAPTAHNQFLSHHRKDITMRHARDPCTQPGQQPGLCSVFGRQMNCMRNLQNSCTRDTPDSPRSFCMQSQCSNACRDMRCHAAHLSIHRRTTLVLKVGTCSPAH
jgi:hypothetical protein